MLQVKKEALQDKINRIQQRYSQLNEKYGLVRPEELEELSKVHQGVNDFQARLYSVLDDNWDDFEDEFAQWYKKWAAKVKKVTISQQEILDRINACKAGVTYDDLIEIKTLMLIGERQYSGVQELIDKIPPTSTKIVLLSGLQQLKNILTKG